MLTVSGWNGAIRRDYLQPKENEASTFLVSILRALCLRLDPKIQTRSASHTLDSSLFQRHSHFWHARAVRPSKVRMKCRVGNMLDGYFTYKLCEQEIDKYTNAQITPMAKKKLNWKKLNVKTARHRSVNKHHKTMFSKLRIFIKLRSFKVRETWVLVLLRSSTAQYEVVQSRSSTGFCFYSTLFICYTQCSLCFFFLYHFSYKSMAFILRSPSKQTFSSIH